MKLLRSWYSVSESSWSIVSWSLLSRETIRPIGVVSKKCIGEKSTPLSAALNSLKPECSEIRLARPSACILCGADGGGTHLNANEERYEKSACANPSAA
jgi:hypothetical protein